MQIKSLRIKSYRSWKINDIVLSDIAHDRHQKIKIYDALRAERCSEKVALKAIQTPRSTFFRWKRRLRKAGPQGLEPITTKPTNIRRHTWSQELESQIYTLRKANPCFGKYKIRILLKKEYGIEKSIAMVGKIISMLIKRNRVKPVLALLGRRYKKKRMFDKYAKRWKYGMKGKQPGELVQIDHMTINSKGFYLKHFKAVCPVTRMMVAYVFKSATSGRAAKFLDYVIKQMPFKVRSIQVDGGSEFMKHFEQACSEKNIELF